jgi:hypothetical protein
LRGKNFVILRRRSQHVKLDAFLFRVLHFLDAGRHLSFATAIQEVSLPGSQPQRRTDRVERRVSAADQSYILATEIGALDLRWPDDPITRWPDPQMAMTQGSDDPILV